MASGYHIGQYGFILCKETSHILRVGPQKSRYDKCYLIDIYRGSET